MQQAVTLKDYQLQLMKALKDGDVEYPGLEAKWIMEQVTGLSRTEQIISENRLMDSAEVSEILIMLKRRLSGEPLDFIFGYKEFYGLRFDINKHVLSPRPETEMLVDFVLERTAPQEVFSLLDLGTGSGAIVISVLFQRPNARAIAVDISEEALKIAKRNAQKHSVSERLKLIQGSWDSAIGETFDFILSNPPYIDSAAMEELSPDVRGYDPEIALHGGDDGLVAYREILKHVPGMMNKAGWLAMEIGFDQGLSVPELIANVGFQNVGVLKDYSGHDRVVFGCNGEIAHTEN